VFKLNFNIPQSEKKINLKDSIYLVGSCFSDEVGSLLERNKFKSLSNPFGTIYNPHTIFKLLRNEVLKDDILESQGVFYHWDCHGQVSGLSKSKLAVSFSEIRNQSNEFVRNTNWLIITLGTSIVYRFKASNKIVGNCHKIPATEFNKEFLSSSEIVDDFNKTLDSLKERNPKLNVILTVSPVRHIKDGFVENNLSKSILIESVHQMVSAHSYVHYFPSYEIMMDELRDYRFYKKDMIHPSEEAIEYIWKRFAETYVDKETFEFLNEWSKIKSALHHKPFQPDSTKHQQFLKNTIEQLNKLNDLVDTRVEREMLQKQLT
jgi:hypothetical protein